MKGRREGDVRFLSLSGPGNPTFATLICCRWVTTLVEATKAGRLRRGSCSVHRVAMMTLSTGSRTTADSADVC